MILLFEILGWTGMVMIVLAYFGVSTGRLKSDEPFFQWMNLLGSIAIGFNVFAKKAWPAVTLEVVWAGIAGYTLICIYTKRLKNA